MFVSFPKNEQPHKSQERYYARLIHESSCFKSFLLILMYSWELFTAQLSKKSKSYPVSCCLPGEREKRGTEELLFCSQETHRNLLPFKMSLHNNNNKEKSKSVHLERRLHKAKLTNLNADLQIYPNAHTW